MYSFTVSDPGEAGAAARALVEDWLAAPALRRIVQGAGETWPESGDVHARISQLHALSERWDFRRGGERMDMRVEDLGVDPVQLMADATELGLASASPPPRDHYEHALVLGGTALASINRVRWLAELIGNGLRVDHPVALTALREIPEREREVIADHGEYEALVDGAPAEFDVLVAAVARFLGGQPDIKRAESEPPDVAAARAVVGSALVLAAASDDPARRANTNDNYRVYAEQLHDGDRVLLVTSSIYVPYQHFLAVLALGRQRPLTIDATGFPPEWMRGVLTGPQNVLQELRSAFFGALKLLEGTS